MEIEVYIYLLLLVLLCGIILYKSKEENAELIYSIFKCIWMLFNSSEGPYKKTITKTINLILLTFSLVFTVVFTT